ncbi:hypothetical protein ACF1CG_15050 [Streptomyces sp. NPDC014773]|uniref:hypothetical protein n=1 Tax=Streptomyces sp. NPDC014773 TaxID=3364908 RepID=UPI0036FB1757
MPAAPAPRPGGGPSAGTVAVRVLVTAAVVLSLGLLAWVAMLRLAIMRRTVRDWVLFWLQLAVTIGCFVLLQEEDENSWQINVGAGLVVAMATAVTAHYLAADIRHHRPAGPSTPGPYAHPQAPGYGYPQVDPGTAATLPGGYPPQGQAPNPYATPAPHAHPTPHATPTPTPHAHPHATPTPQPHPAPHPAAPAGSPRIDQVRAELDELSDLLRKEGEK